MLMREDQIRQRIAKLHNKFFKTTEDKEQIENLQQQLEELVFEKNKIKNEYKIFKFTKTVKRDQIKSYFSILSGVMD